MHARKMAFGPAFRESIQPDRVLRSWASGGMTLRAMKTLTGVWWRALTVVLLSGAVGLRGQTPSGAVPRARPVPEPPVLTWEEITPVKELPGKVIDMEDKGVKYT